MRKTPRLDWFPGALAVLLICLVTSVVPTYAAIGDAPYVSADPGPGRFALSVEGKPAPLCVSALDWPGVRRVATIFQEDVGRVSGAPPTLYRDKFGFARKLVLIGTLRRNPLIDQLVRHHKLDVSDIVGKRETFLVQVVDAGEVHGLKLACVLLGRVAPGCCPHFPGEIVIHDGPGGIGSTQGARLGGHFSQ